MELQELKNKILTNTLSDSFLILVYSDTDFIVNQYIDQICNIKNYNKIIVQTLADVNNLKNKLFGADQDLYIICNDTFSEDFLDYSIFTNCIISCKNIDKNIFDKVKNYIVTVPAPVSWQVQDYMKVICPGLDLNNYNWLYETAEHDLYKITNELDKLTLFDITDKQQIYNFIKFDKFGSIYNITQTQLANSIETLDKIKLNDYLIYQQNCDIEAIGLIKILIYYFKLIFYIKYVKATANELAISDKQYFYLNKNINLSSQFLILALKFLSELDLKIKEGRIELQNNILVSYIICRLLSF